MNTEYSNYGNFKKEVKILEGRPGFHQKRAVSLTITKKLPLCPICGKETVVFRDVFPRGELFRVGCGAEWSKCELPILYFYGHSPDECIDRFNKEYKNNTDD